MKTRNCERCGAEIRAIGKKRFCEPCAIVNNREYQRRYNNHKAEPGASFHLWLWMPVYLREWSRDMQLGSHGGHGARDGSRSHGRLYARQRKRKPWIE